MIGRLRGELISKQPPRLLLEVNGVGYEMEAPMSTFYALPAVGETVTLSTHLLVREDAQTLYAFTNESERAMFRNLLKVNGVGAKMALAILSGMDAQSFSRCVREGDAQSLIRLPGVGRKTAERLIIEMRDRIDKISGDLATAEPAEQVLNKAADPVEDAVHALISLGYKPPEASRMVNRVDAKGRSSEDIIRLALKASLS